MKKFFLLIALVALSISCDDKEPKETVLVDYGYDWKFYVKNETDKKIVLTEEYPWGPFGGPFTLANGDSQMIAWNSRLGGESKSKREDLYEDGDYRFGVGGVIGVGDTYYINYAYTMTADDKKVSDDIWLRKYWSFESDFYVCTYALIVTDELLEQLAEEEE